MPKQPRVPAADLPPGAVRRAGEWAVVNRDGRYAAVSRRCRHQLADLSKGTLDPDGCLVCPWHGSGNDVRPGEMADGPRGFLHNRGPTPGYSALVKAFGATVKLRVRRALRRGDDVVVQDA